LTKSERIAIFGTAEPTVAPMKLSAGPVEALFEPGGLRQIRFHGVEILRGIAFLVRDRNWGTAIPELSDLKVETNEADVVVSFRGRCAAMGEALTFSAHIRCEARGNIDFRVTGETKTGFTTNRIGFSILHPCEDLAGAPLTVGHTDGTLELSCFPDMVMPTQPVTDIETLEWAPAPGVTAICRVDDDAYEMEDQRNWADASFKTYYRPLSKGWPYRLEPGSQIAQSVVLELSGRPQVRRAREVATTSFSRMPEIAVACDCDDLDAAVLPAEALRAAGIGWIFCHVDSERRPVAESMSGYAQLCHVSGARLVLDAVLPLKGADGQWSDDLALLNGTVTELAKEAFAAGAVFDAVIAVPDCYRKSWQPTGTWPVAPPLNAVEATLRTAFPAARIGGGMQSYFPELNRKRPAPGSDFVTHSFCPIVHAADDLSVMENLGAMPAIARSARALLPGKPYWIGPSGIAMRHNPYADAPLHKPGGRVAMNDADPRMRGLFGAAWALGLFSTLAEEPPDLICLGSLGGVNALFDKDGKPSPLWSLLSELAPFVGAQARRFETAPPVLGLSLDGRQRAVFLANTSDAPLSVPGLPQDGLIRRMTAKTVQGTDHWSDSERLQGLLRLSAYEVVQLSFST
jgi:hypothetical protein